VPKYHGSQTKKLDRSGEYFSCNRERRKPRQPGSSDTPPPKKKVKAKDTGKKA
jgi:hypothetical protein